MKSKFRQIALLGKYHLNSGSSANPSSRQTLESIAQFLHTFGCEVVIEHDTATGSGLNGYTVMNMEEIGASCDLAIVLGGDGTMLGYARQLAPHDIPLIGINQGRLGFITDIPIEEFEQTLKPMMMGDFEEEQRSMLHAQVWRDKHCVFDAFAMNDVVVNRGATSGMVELRIEVDGRFVATQRADGLIVATPTGSTAYSLSAGGPLMHPNLGGWVIAPIAPHTLSNRPIVLPDTSKISIEIVSGRDASANFDMQSLASLMIGDQITVEQSKYKVRFLHPQGWNYFDTLRKKMHWNEGGV